MKETKIWIDADEIFDKDYLNEYYGSSDVDFSAEIAIEIAKNRLADITYYIDRLYAERRILESWLEGEHESVMTVRQFMKMADEKYFTHILDVFVDGHKLEYLSKIEFELYMQRHIKNFRLESDHLYIITLEMDKILKDHE